MPLIVVCAVVGGLAVVATYRWMIEAVWGAHHVPAFGWRRPSPDGSGEIRSIPWGYAVPWSVAVGLTVALSLAPTRTFGQGMTAILLWGAVASVGAEVVRRRRNRRTDPPPEPT